VRRGTLIAIVALFLLLAVIAFVQIRASQRRGEPRPTITPTATPAGP
jgi:hypothetical protein